MFMHGNVDESDFGCDVDKHVAGMVWQVDAVEDVEFGCGWRNWSNVSPECSLNRVPDSRKGVRQFNRFIGVAPVLWKFVLDHCNCQVPPGYKHAQRRVPCQK